MGAQRPGGGSCPYSIETGFHRGGQARESVAQGPDIGKAAYIESEARFTLHAGACPPYSQPFHSKARLAVLEHKCFTHLDREIFWPGICPGGWPRRGLKTKRHRGPCWVS